MTRLILLAALILLASPALAGTIYTKDGGSIEVNDWREAGGVLYYRYHPGADWMSMPRADVLRIHGESETLVAPPPLPTVPWATLPPVTELPPCAATTITQIDLDRTARRIEIATRLAMRGVAMRLRSCLGLQQRAHHGEVVAPDLMAQTCCVSG
jgi:hypothetical protein